MKYNWEPCTEADTAFLWEKLDEIVPTPEGTEEALFVFKVTGPQGGIAGGCVLDVDMMKTAEFNSIWVDEPYRRRGVGTALIRAAEQKARGLGCREIVNAYTFDWQEAKSLFEKRGYRLIATVKDWPKGHEGYTLTKRLDGDFAEEPADEAAFAVVPGSEEDGEIIRGALEATFRSTAPRSHPYLNLDRKLTDGAGKVIAGCVAGVSGWDTMYVDLLWVDAPYRGKGIGTALLRQVEREAKENGAYLARINAPERPAAFFRKHGYPVVVTFENEPKWVVMQKHL